MACRTNDRVDEQPKSGVELNIEVNECEMPRVGIRIPAGGPIVFRGSSLRCRSCRRNRRTEQKAGLEAMDIALNLSSLSHDIVDEARADGLKEVGEDDACRFGGYSCGG